VTLRFVQPIAVALRRQGQTCRRSARCVPGCFRKTEPRSQPERRCPFPCNPVAESGEPASSVTRGSGLGPARRTRRRTLIPNRSRETRLIGTSARAQSPKPAPNRPEATASSRGPATTTSATCRSFSDDNSAIRIPENRGVPGSSPGLAIERPTGASARRSANQSRNAPPWATATTVSTMPATVEVALP
jgi:hypothetical protein